MPAPSILVVGAGAWGSALANAFARARCRVYLWGRDGDVLAHIAHTRRHPRLPPDWIYEPSVEPLTEVARAGAVDCTVFAVPFQTLREVATLLFGAGLDARAVACASKGFELEGQRLAHEIVAEVAGAQMPFAQISGPNFAAEVMAGAPAAVTIGASTAALGEALTVALHSTRFRPYYTDDVIGVEIGGALKNVMAIAAGIADGLELGANTRAALITRGLAEIARYGRVRGGRTETFMGLSGIGDLVLTCTDDQSRNRRFGLAVGRHGDIERAAREVGALVEGVATTHAVAAMAARHGIAMPIATAVAAVLGGASSPVDAVLELLRRDLTSEAD